MAAANRAAALAANSKEGAFARDRALFLGGGAEGAPAGSPEAPGAPSGLSEAALRARRREGARRFGRKAMSVFMAVVLAIGLMPLPAFGDDGQVKGVSFNGNLIAGSVSTTTTVDADGNVTTETTQTKVDDEGNVVTETTTDESSGEDDGGKLDEAANARGQYLLNQATALKSDGTIQDLAGTDGIGKVSDGSDGRLSVAAGAQAVKDKEDEAQQSAVDEAQAAFGAEDAAIDVSGLGGLDFSSQRIVVALKDGASLMERDLNNVTSKADDMYVLAYKNADAAKRAYVRYTNYGGADFAAPDVAVEAAGEGDEGDDDDPDPVDVPTTESGDVDYTKVAKDGAEADDAEQARTDAPEADTSTYDADKKEAEERSEQRAKDEENAPDEQRTVVVVVIDTMVAQDAPVAARLSLVSDAQETVADDDPDHDAKLDAQRGRHGSKMVDAIVSQLEASGAQAVDADGNRLAGSGDDGARKVQIVSIEALDASNYGSAGTVLAAAQLAAAYRPDVVNMSFAGYATEGNKAISEAVELLAEGPDGEAGTADDADVVAAAGNENQDARWFVPASSEGAYAVGALDASKVEALREQVAREMFGAVTAGGASAASPGGLGTQSVPSPTGDSAAGSAGGQADGASAGEGEAAGNGDAALSLDDGQAAQLDAEVEARIAADPLAYKNDSSNHGETVDAWVVAGSTSEAAAQAAGYAAADPEGWRDSISTSSFAVGSSREFGAASEAEPQEPEASADDGAQEPEGGDSAEDSVGALGAVYDKIVSRVAEEGVSAASDGTYNVSGDGGTYVAANGVVTVTFSYTGSVQRFTAPYDGSYTIKAYGAKGGNSYKATSTSALGGQGGTATGTYKMSKGGVVYAAAGGAGTNSSTGGATFSGGWNGGGDGGNFNTNDYYGSGGGATHVATSNRGTLNNYASYKSELLLVAGGGGGGGYYSGYYNNGGAGGGQSGQAGSDSGRQSGNAAGGGTQSAGGASGYTSSVVSRSATFGLGGAANSGSYRGAGGGGGYYGGGGIHGWGCAGGGGSGFLQTGNADLTGTSYTVGGNNGAGYVTISYPGTQLKIHSTAGSTTVSKNFYLYSGDTVPTGDQAGVAATKTVDGKDLPFAGWSKSSDASTLDFPATSTAASVTISASSSVSSYDLYPAYGNYVTYYKKDGTTVAGYSLVNADNTATLRSAEELGVEATGESEDSPFRGWTKDKGSNRVDFPGEWADAIAAEGLTSANNPLYPVYGDYAVVFASGRGDAELGGGEDTGVGASASVTWRRYHASDFKLPDAAAAESSAFFGAGNTGWRFLAWEVYASAAEGAGDPLDADAAPSSGTLAARVPGGATLVYDDDRKDGSFYYMDGDDRVYVSWVGRDKDGASATAAVAAGSTVHVRAIWQYDSLETTTCPEQPRDLGVRAMSAGCSAPRPGVRPGDGLAAEGGAA